MKHRLMFVILLLLVVMVASPLSALAQDGDDMEMEEYVAESGLFSFSYPVDWVIDVAEDEGTITIGNSEESLEAVLSDEEVPLEPGQFGLQVIFFPVDLMAMMGIDLEAMMPEEGEDGMSEEMLQSFVESFMFSEEEDEEALPELGEVYLIELEDGGEIGIMQFTLESIELEGAFILVGVNEGVYAFGLAGAYAGEYAEYEDIMAAILDSIEFNMTGEEFLGLMMGGMMGEEDEGE